MVRLRKPEVQYFVPPRAQQVSLAEDEVSELRFCGSHGLLCEGGSRSRSS